MNQLVDFFGFLAISQLLFMGMLNLLLLKQGTTGRLIALLCLCLIAVVFAIMPDDQFPVPFGFWVARLAVATPAVLWITTHSFFEDEQSIPIPAWIILIGYQIISALRSLLQNDFPVIADLILEVSYCIMLGLALHVIYLALKGRETDLLEDRRQLRVIFSCGQGIIVAVILVQLLSASIMTEEIFTDSVLDINLVISFALIFFFTLAINLNYFRNLVQANSAVLAQGNDTHAAGASLPKHSGVNPRTLARVKELMEQEKLYLDPELTIRELAAKVNTGEHKLRKVINEGLGYRNFNQFLSEYRIAEAKKLLLDEENSPIYVIAMEVGYASLSSFNKAFKDFTGLTPSNFRSKAASDEQEISSKVSLV